MKPIDNERLDMALSLSTLQKSTASVSTASSKTDHPMVQKEENTMQELIAYINSTTQVGTAHENRLNHLKNEIRNNQYQIDFDQLAANILVSENEF